MLTLYSRRELLVGGQARWSARWRVIGRCPTSSKKRRGTLSGRIMEEASGQCQAQQAADLGQWDGRERAIPTPPS